MFCYLIYNLLNDNIMSEPVEYLQVNTKIVNIKHYYHLCYIVIIHPKRPSWTQPRHLQNSSQAWRRVTCILLFSFSYTTNSCLLQQPLLSLHMYFTAICKLFNKLVSSTASLTEPTLVLYLYLLAIQHTHVFYISP